MITRDQIRSLADAMAYYTDCAIATYVQTVLVKKYSKADRKRAHDIALGMVKSLEEYDATHKSMPALLTRLADAVRDHDSIYSRELPR